MNTPSTTTNTSIRRELEGVVVKKSGAKTVAVEVVRVLQHPLYRKRVKRSKRYLAHDSKDQYTVGQHVVIRESRPLSARKRWVVVSVVTEKK